MVKTLTCIGNARIIQRYVKKRGLNQQQQYKKHALKQWIIIKIK